MQRGATGDAGSLLLGIAIRLAWKSVLVTLLPLLLILLVVIAGLCTAYSQPTFTANGAIGWLQDRLRLTPDGPTNGSVLGGGPVYVASAVNLGGDLSMEATTIHDLGFGPSDSGRIDRMIRVISPDSPLVGQGDLILALGQRFRVDPLLIAQWQFESGMATTGINSPANGGNMTWDAAGEASELYGCTRGPSSLGHVWASCPDLTAGLSLWHDYVGRYYPARGIDRFDRYVDAYNPCSDSARYGFVCGREYGLEILRLIGTTAGPPVDVTAGGEYYRYQGEPGSYDSYGSEQANCGPASVAMAIGYARGLRVPIRDIRDYIGRHGEYTSLHDLTSALEHWGVAHSPSIRDSQDLREVVAHGDIALVLLTMSAISPGADLAGASTDPALNHGRYSTFVGPHWVVVKGVSSDGRYFIVHDPNVWGSAPNPGYWYSDGSAKGEDRLYLASELEAGMSALSSPGLEITSTPGSPAFAHRDGR